MSIDFLHKKMKNERKNLMCPEEEQTTQWPKDQVQMDKQRYTIHYTENYRSSDTNPTKSYVIFRKGIIQFCV
jgi:hypothetical protein